MHSSLSYKVKTCIHLWPMHLHYHPLALQSQENCHVVAWFESFLVCSTCVEPPHILVDLGARFILLVYQASPSLTHLPESGCDVVAQ